MRYVIDLERINQLTAPHPGDSTEYVTTSVFSVSKSLIKKWVDIWENRTQRTESEEKVKLAFHNLRYNKILLTESDLRDMKLNSILDESPPTLKIV